MSDIQNLTEQYFDCFKKKDIKSLRNLYDENVTLKDWDVDLQGVDNMIKANASLFLLNYDLRVNKTIVVEDSTQNWITLDFGDSKIDVVDVIKFSNDKIVSVNAYLESYHKSEKE